VVLDLDGLILNLFISPERHHYYFGDYYGTEYSREGFHPWYEARDRHDWYDPIFAHQQWRHRDDHNWLANQREGYDHRRDDKSLRPARTYEAMRTQVARLPENDRGQAQMGRPMKEVASQKTPPFKFEKVDAKTREATASRAKDVRAYNDKRSQWESPAAAPKESSRTPSDVQPQRVKVSRSPITVREPVRDKELAPPSRPKYPQPDLNAKPRPSKTDSTDRSKDNDRSDKDKPDSTRK
jgi:hypothetical protein